MFGICTHCGQTNCWGHTNDEITEMEGRKRAESNASDYYARYEKAEAKCRRLLTLIERQAKALARADEALAVAEDNFKQIESTIDGVFARDARAEIAELLKEKE